MNRNSAMRFFFDFMHRLPYLGGMDNLDPHLHIEWQLHPATIRQLSDAKALDPDGSGLLAGCTIVATKTVPSGTFQIALVQTQIKP